MLIKSTLITLTILLFHSFLYSQYRLNITISDSLTSEPISGVKAETDKTSTGVYSDESGVIKIELMQPGVIELKITKMGYRTYSLTILVENSITNLDISLQPSGFTTDTIDVSSLYFHKPEKINTSFVNAEYEEIRRSPGAMEDVIRYFTSSPGVSLGSDINNEIIVRGGSPVENLTLLDGLVIQNPNHYGAPGSTNGILSYINLKMVKDVDFFSGGFPPEYGDRLSSVMNIKLKEGNLKRHIRDINISATGFGGFFEGPFSKSSSYLFSVRRSYYELIKEMLNTQLIPEYWDFNTKLNFNLSPKERFSIIGFFATDNAKPFKEGDYMYDTVHVKILSTGFNYEKEGRDFKYTAVAGYGWNFYKVNYDDFILDINDNEISLTQKLDYTINRTFSVNLFTGTRNFFSHYNVQHGDGFNASNFYTPHVQFDDNVKTMKISGGLNLTSRFLKDRLVINAGLRVDAFQLLSNKIAVSPRAGVTYKITPVTTINANAGIYHQAPEMLWVLVDPENRNLTYIRVEELVLGFEHLFSADIKLTVEPYLKQYYNYPVSVYDPNYIFINSGVELYPNFLDKATSSGKGYFAGVDVTLQKKNSGKGSFGTISYSYSKSEFLALRGEIQPAEFDYGNQLMMIAGYRFKNGLSFSGRFKFAKGRPYTPYDMSKSTIFNGIYDSEMYNKARMPDYARLDLRVDYQVNFGNTVLTTYLEVLNVLDRVNYYNYYWSSYYEGVRANLQLPRVPILGLSYRF